MGLLIANWATFNHDWRLKFWVGDLRHFRLLASKLWRFFYQLATFKICFIKENYVKL